MQRLALITLTLAAFAAAGVAAQAPAEGGLETRVWLDRGEDPVLKRGETVRIYYRTNQDAYAAIFRIDTDGHISMIFPGNPSEERVVSGGRDYRLIFPNAPIWRVSEDPGVGYFFMVASPDPLDFSAFPFDPVRGWDLGAVGDVVYQDPYVAIDDYVALLIPDWEVAPYALDFVTYDVGDTYTYPRFLCYDCHNARPYSSWNPYSVPCTSYRVVIWDDPYFYPSYRYSGLSVVVARPVTTLPRYAVTVRAPGDSFRPIIRSRAAPPRTVADYKEPIGTPAQQITPRRTTPQTADPAPRPTLQRRATPSATPTPTLPRRTPPSPSATPSAPDRGAPDARIVRPAPRTAPSTTPQSTPTRPSDRVTPTPRSAPSGTRSPTPSRGTTRSATPSRPSAQPTPQSRPTAPARPTPRPTTPSRPTPSTPSRPSPQPSTQSRPSARPAPQSRPSTQPSAPSRPQSRPTAPASGRRPTVQPRPGD